MKYILITLLLFSCLLLSIGENLAQNAAFVSHSVQFPKSPNVASFSKYVEQPVNIQNGTINISIPVYAIEGRELTVPIHLNYHTSGIKVNTVSSWVGLGWNLSAGGVISRSPIGIPDEIENGYAYLSNYQNIKNAEDFNYLNEDDWLLLRHLYHGKADREPDIYNFNMPGYSGSFILGNDGKYYTEDLSNVKIVETRIGGYQRMFELTVPDGTIYRFGKDLDGNDLTEKTKVTSYRYSEYVVPSTSAWHLTEIISPSRRDTIFYKYTTYTTDAETTVSSQIAYIDGANPNTPTTHTTLNIYEIQNVRELDEILFANGKVKFIRQYDRLDDNLSRLSSIEIYSVNGAQSDKIKTIVFDNSNSYFDRSGGVEVWSGAYSNVDKSLKLNGVEIKDENNATIEAYQFQYNSLNLPNRGTTSQDYWGYNNGRSTNQSLVPKMLINGKHYGDAIREPNAAAVKASILTKVIYPTGGKAEYVYEPNYYLSESEQSSQTKRVSNNKNVMAVGEITNPDPSMQLEEKLIDELTFTATESGYLVFNWEFSATSSVTPPYYPTIEIWENLSSGTTNSLFKVVYHGTTEEMHGQELIQISSGNSYTIRAETCAGCVSPTSIIGAPIASATLVMDDFVVITDPSEFIVYQGGGVRIKKIKFFANKDDLLPVKTKTYEYGEGKFGSLQLGVGKLVNDNYINTFHTTKMEWDRTLWTQTWRDDYNNTVDQYGPRNYQNIDDHMVIRGLTFKVSANSFSKFGQEYGQVEYNKVTEIFGDENSNIGKIEYYYNDSEGHIAMYGSPWSEFDYLQFPKHLSGRLKEKRVYAQQDGIYDIVEKTVYNHSVLFEKTIKALKVFPRDIYRIGQLTDVYNSNPIQPLDDYSIWRLEPLVPYNYYLKIGKQVLSSEETTTYSTDESKNIVVSKAYAYDPLYYQVNNVTISGSDLVDNTIKTKYTYDRASIAGLSNQEEIALAQMEIQGRIGEDIEIQKFKGETLLETTRKNFEVDVSNIIKANSIDHSNGMTELDEIINFEIYDENENLIQFFDVRLGQRTGIIWAYNNQYPVVKGENIDHTTLQSAVNLAMGSVSGYSTLDGLMDALIGKLHGGTGNLRSTWSSFNTALRNDAALAHALITTYTYDPLVGMTSRTDPSGVTTYYEYDDFGRLRHILDSEGNVVQQYQYHYANQQ